MEWRNEEATQCRSKTKGKFGFHLAGGKDDPQGRYANVEIYVNASALSRRPMYDFSASDGEVDIDRFVDDAIASLQAIRIDAKNALAAGNLS